ncbi:MAG: acetyl-CoA carboxylase biotin carboxyl carrier protein [Bacteroidota bacterium]|nr:acetyl-CoA carboxylase biotin carboxyl carrier protein [Bacteroidota bacterium]
MDFKQIQELIRLVSETNIGEVTIEQKEFKLTIRQKEEQVTQIVSASMPSGPAHPAMTQPVTQQALPQAPAPATASEKAPSVSTSAAINAVSIKSPMIGTFYRKSAPDKPNLVEVGDTVMPGQVVCIIEAMKLFNEIESEVKGTIVKVLVEDASPVEYDQPLFLVEPS